MRRDAAPPPRNPRGHFRTRLHYAILIKAWSPRDGRCLKVFAFAPWFGSSSGTRSGQKLERPQSVGPLRDRRDRNERFLIEDEESPAGGLPQDPAKETEKGQPIEPAQESREDRVPALRADREGDAEASLPSPR